MRTSVALITLILFSLSFLTAASGFLGRDVVRSIIELSQNRKKSVTDHGRVISRFAVLSDTHSDTEATQSALEQAKALGVTYLIHTGDWTKVGTIAELKEQKELFDRSSIPYWGIMGDHDRWQSGSRNFEAVMGKPYEAFEKNGLQHILLDASDLDNALGETQLDWLERQLQSSSKPTLIFMHLPVYHPTSDRTLGSKAGTSARKVEQTKRFLGLIKDKNVKAIFSGDHHFSSSFSEPQTDVRIFIVGAVTRERNLQSPRFTLVEVYEDFFIKATDQVID